MINASTAARSTVGVFRLNLLRQLGVYCQKAQLLVLPMVTVAHLFLLSVATPVAFAMPCCCFWQSLGLGCPRSALEYLQNVPIIHGDLKPAPSTLYIFSGGSKLKTLEPTSLNPCFSSTRQITSCFRLGEKSASRLAV